MAMLKAFLVGMTMVCGALSLLPQAQAKEPQGDGHAWLRYTNVRFQYGICYPKDVLTAQREADNSDGRKFTGKDGAELAVWGSNNALDSNLKQEIEESGKRLAGPNGKVTYRAMHAKWAVVSGENGDGLFYAKIFYNRKADQFKDFEMTYNKSQAALYNPIVSKISGCFADLD
jgi:hypothetical protein